MRKSYLLFFVLVFIGCSARYQVSGLSGMERVQAIGQ